MYPGASLWLLLALLASARAAEPPWGDWIIVDDNEPGSSILLRRITPKSVFVAPTFNGCSEGYRQDSLGRCVKVVNVDQQKQWSFFLERLNSMYAVTTSKNPQKEAGPFHVNLPLGESSQEDSIVNKRKPPKFSENGLRTTQRSDSQSTTTARPMPTPTRLNKPEFIPTTEVQPLSTSDNFKPEFILSSTERRRETTTDSSFDTDAMLGDQPATTEESSAASPSKPKNRKENNNKVNRPVKPFVIIVTNEPTPRNEETTNIPTTCTPQITEEERESTSQPPSTSEWTEGTTETTSFSTDATPRSTEYDASFSETRDYTEPSTDPTVRYDPTTVRPKCDPFSRVKDDLIDSSDCEPVETFVVSDDRRRRPSAPLSANQPPLEPARVRFPTETVLPVRNTQTFVRFPEVSEPHEDRPSFWWPTWQVRQHPGIRGWPPPDDKPPQPVAQKQYPVYGQPGHTWADTIAWRRRFLQRD